MPYKPFTTYLLGSEITLSLRCKHCNQYPAVHNQKTNNCPGEITVHVCVNNCPEDTYSGVITPRIIRDPSGSMSDLVCFACDTPMQTKTVKE